MAGFLDRAREALRGHKGWDEQWGSPEPKAPVIINGELQTGIGGGVCQVSTSVFRAALAAWAASGLPSRWAIRWPR